MTPPFVRLIAIAALAAGILVAAAAPSAVGQAAGSDFCPAYEASDEFRSRANEITVGPDSDWERALADAAPGTTVLLQDGTYQMTRYAVYLANPNITIRGASGNRDAVVIQGQGYSVGGEGLMVAAPGITIADLSITGIRNHAISLKPDAGEAGASSTYMYNVNLVDNGTQQIKGSSGGDNNGGILACSAIGYTADGIQGDYIGAIDLHQSTDWIIRDNYIYGVSGDGTGCEIDIDCGRYSASHPAILLWNGSGNIVVERNTIVDSWRAITLGLGTRFEGGAVRNNFIYQSESGDAGIELWDVHDVVVEHNTVLVIDYPGAIEYGGSTNITLRNNLLSAEPLDRPSRGTSTGMSISGNITDATTSDLATAGQPQLPAGSRAIGAGVPSALDVDIDGDARTGRWDVGADQRLDQPEPPVPPVNDEVDLRVSCLAGNGRVDPNVVNTGDSAAVYRLEFAALSPREITVAPRDWWRSPVTGRPDGDHDVIVKRNGTVILDTTVTIDCDSNTPQVSEPEVSVVNACRLGNGYLLFQFVNPGATAKGYVIEFDGVPNRSTTAAPFGASVRAVTGRPDGDFTAVIRSGQTTVATMQVNVDCSNS